MAEKDWPQEPAVAVHTGIFSICSICSQEAERGQGEGEMFSLLFFLQSGAPSLWDGSGNEGRAFPPQPSLKTASQTCPKVCSRWL
jgi:hypothetical protein